MKITIATNQHAGEWMIVARSGWGSDGQSARLLRVGKSGKVTSRGINLSAGELAKLGIAMKIDPAKPQKTEKAPEGNEWTSKREAAVKRGLAMMQGIEPGQPILSASDKRRREKAYKLIATA